MILENTKCIMCKKERTRKLIQVRLPENKSSYIVECKFCKLRYLQPRPKNVEKLYSNVYWELSDNKEKEINNKRFNYIIQQLEKYHKNLKKVKILEIGIGDGTLMSMLPNRYEKCGTELTKSQIKDLKKKGIENVYEGEFENIKFKNKFDIILLVHVIEHLKNPREFVKSAKKNLEKKGLLIILTPNDKSLLQKVAKLPIIRKFTIENDPYIRKKIKRNIEVWTQKKKGEFGLRRFLIHTLHHFFFFDPKSLKKLLQSESYRVRKIHTGTIHPNKFPKKIIQNKITNSISKLFGMQEEIFIVAKKK